MTALSNLLQQTILIVDDEQTIRDTLKYNLVREGYRVLTAADGAEALRLVDADAPDLVVLDIMMPGLTGFDVCRVLRKKSTMPVLMLSAREDEIDKVVALEIGADDYMTKPFSLRELLARVRAMLRRAEIGIGAPPREDVQTPQTAAPPSGSIERPATAQVGDRRDQRDPGQGAQSQSPQRIVDGDLVIEPASRTVLLSGREVSLKPKEFDLLAFLAAHPGRVFTREVLLEQVWGYDYVGTNRTVDSHISSLRKKLERSADNPQIIETVFGIGYKLNRLQSHTPAGRTTEKGSV